jgi:hypothetical protein
VPRPDRARRRGRPVALRELLASRGRGDRISRAEVALACPPGGRRPLSRREVMRAFHGDPRLATLRADFAGHLVATMQFLARETSWADLAADPRGTCRPTRARVCAALEYCVSTWKACRRLLQAWGWVGLLRAGRSEGARRMSAAAGLQYDGNDAAVYGLFIPRLPRAKKQPVTPAAYAAELTRPPTYGAADSTGTPRGPVETARDTAGRTALRAGSFPKPADLRPLATGPGIEKLSEKAVAAAWRPFEAALWSVADWLYAVGHWPDGRPHAINPPAVRFPASWLRWRLSHWLDPADGRPVLSPGQVAAAARAAGAAARAREAAALTRIPGADPGPAYLAARAALGRTRKGK